MRHPKTGNLWSLSRDFGSVSVTIVRFSYCVILQWIILLSNIPGKGLEPSDRIESTLFAAKTRKASFSSTDGTSDETGRSGQSTSPHTIALPESVRTFSYLTLSRATYMYNTALNLSCFYSSTSTTLDRGCAGSCTGCRTVHALVTKRYDGCFAWKVLAKVTWPEQGSRYCWAAGYAIMTEIHQAYSTFLKLNHGKVEFTAVLTSIRFNVCARTSHTVKTCWELDLYSFLPWITTHQGPPPILCRLSAAIGSLIAVKITSCIENLTDMAQCMLYVTLLILRTFDGTHLLLILVSDGC